LAHSHAQEKGGVSRRYLGPLSLSDGWKVAQVFAGEDGQDARKIAMPILALVVCICDVYVE